MPSPSVFLRAFKSLNLMERLFFISICASCSLQVYLIFYLVPETFVGFVISILTMGLVLFYLQKYTLDSQLWLKREIFLYIIMGVMILHLPVLFLGSSRVAVRKTLKDEMIIKMDTFFLGWAFPKGQLALYLDNNSFLGPLSSFGQLINNTLQIFYFLYYFIPYFSLYGLGLYRCVKETLFRKRSLGGKSETYKKTWAKTFYYFSAYNFTYICVFFINTIVPASSPRLYLKEEFTNPLKLTGIAGFLNRTCKDDKSANSFPSGHVAETIVFAFCLFFTGEKLYGSITLFMSFMIAAATLFLRYHYFSDALSGIIIALGSSLLCYFIGYKKAFEETPIETDVNEHIDKEYTKQVEMV